MGKRYFCDYCQRSFVDDIDSRKMHLNGLSHIRMKKEYYAVNRDLKTLISEERAKEVCRRFRNTGECSFGLACNHTHYSPEELMAFEKTVEQQGAERARLQSIEDWLAKKSVKNNENIPDAMAAQGGLSSADPSLPPSLRPPTLDEMKSACFSEWG